MTPTQIQQIILQKKQLIKRFQNWEISFEDYKKLDKKISEIII